MKYKSPKNYPQRSIVEHVLLGIKSENDWRTSIIRCNIYYQCLLTDLQVLGVNSHDPSFKTPKLISLPGISCWQDIDTAVMMGGLHPSFSLWETLRLVC